MELEEWEFLSENGFPNAGHEAHFNPTGVFDVDYFTDQRHVLAPTVPEIEVEKIPDEINAEAVTVTDKDTVFQIVFDEWKGRDEELLPEPNSGITEAGLGDDDSLEQESAESFALEADEAGDEGYNGLEIKGSASQEGLASRWRSGGIGALCSIGMAAASLFILVWGGNQRHVKQHTSQMNASDKRIGPVLKQATEMGASMTTKACISFGGKYDGINSP